MNRIHRNSSTVAIVLMLLAGAFPALAQYTLQLTPSSVALSAQAGSTAPVSGTLVPSTNAPVGTQVAFLASPSLSTPWLSISPTSGNNLPAAFTVTANPTGLAAGPNVGKVTITIAGTQQEVTVTLNLGQLSASPASVAFTYQVGATAPSTQSVQINSPSVVAFRVEQSTVNGGDWLEATPASGSTAVGSSGTVSALIGISLKSTALSTIAAGAYTGKVTVTPLTGVTVPLEIPVTLTVTPVPTLTAVPGALAFNVQTGVAAVTEQQFMLSTTGGQLVFVATPSPSVNWLSVFPSSGTISAGSPVPLRITVYPDRVVAGNYSTEIVIAAQGATTARVPITLNVSNSPLLTMSPMALTFNYQMGDVAPTDQSVATASTSTAIAYNVTTATSWIDVRAATGTTPGAIAIGVSPGTLTAGTYTGTVTVSAPGNANQNIAVTLKVANDPLIMADGTASPSVLPFVYQTGQVSTAPPNIAVSLTSNTGAPLNYSATTNAAWLTATATAAATPGALAVSANPAGLAAGPHEGVITVTATNPSGAAVPNSPLNIPVKLYVSTSALLFTNSPTPLTLSSVGGTPAEKELAIYSTGEALRWTAITETPWLSVGPNLGTTGTSVPVTVRATPGLLGPGKYTGSVQVSAVYVSSGAAVPNSPVTVPVILTVAAGSLQLSANSLSFTAPLGGSAPAQNITVASTSGALSFSAMPSANWITVTPTGGATPGQISVQVSNTGMPQGTYQGTVTITSPGAANSPQTIQVNLTVAAAQTILLNPASLSFNYQVGGQTPPAQSVVVTSTGGTLGFTAAAATTSGGQWLSIEPVSGPTPSTLAIRVNPANLAAGRYEGTVTVTAAAASNTPQTLTVVLTVAALPAPAVTAIVNAASWAAGPVAPGEIVVIGGTNFGPAAMTELKLTSQGTVETTLDSTQVLFDGIAAPLIYVSGAQIGAVVPYEIAGRVTTRVQVRYKETTSSALELRVADTAPGIFAANSAGSGQGSIINQDYSINSSVNPAVKGSWVVVYATGEGQTNPRGITGRVTPNTAEGLARPLVTPTVTIGGRPAQVLYAGSAPQFVAGVLQLNVVVPEDAPSGSQPLVITLGTASSQSNVTVAIR